MLRGYWVNENGSGIVFTLCLIPGTRIKFKYIVHLHMHMSVLLLFALVFVCVGGCVVVWGGGPVWFLYLAPLSF